ncbi:MAG: sulfatase family protein [Gemmataceae bacterium]
MLQALVIALLLAPRQPTLETRPKAIVLIYADDLGYGDLGCQGASRVKTPHMDRLAREGLRHTSAYCTSATCTPSRYGLLTGEYPWRRKGTTVLPGDANLVIEPGRTTLPRQLQKAGYRTGVVGKWHLGLGKGKVDWNREIFPGPQDIGFDTCFLVPATGDRVPCVYVRDRTVENLDPADPITVSYGKPLDDGPTGKSRPDLLKMKPSHGHDMTIVNGISRIGHMTGGAKARWVDEEMADTLTREAVRFIERSADQPFFLFFALHDIHVPRVPHPRFAGSSGMGPRGDAIVQADWCVGQILQALEAKGIAKNSLVLLSSDNGPVVDDGYQDDAVAKLGNHRPAGPWRGGKYSRFEGGTRVPLLVRWPARVKPGTESSALVSQVDFLASFSALVGNTDAVSTAPDSQNQLGALLGEETRGRQSLVIQGLGDGPASKLALRQGDWKYLEPAKGPARSAPTNTELANDPKPQLYHLGNDPGETRNLAETEAARVSAMAKALEAIRKGEK